MRRLYRIPVCGQSLRRRRGNKAGAPQPDLGFVITSCRFEEIGNLTAAATATPILLTYGCTEVTLNASGGG
jgi:hypothetical protein